MIRWLLDLFRSEQDRPMTKDDAKALSEEIEKLNRGLRELRAMLKNE